MKYVTSVVTRELQYVFLKLMLFLDGKEQHLVNILEWSCEQPQHNQFSTINIIND